MAKKIVFKSTSYIDVEFNKEFTYRYETNSALRNMIEGNALDSKILAYINKNKASLVFEKKPLGELSVYLEKEFEKIAAKVKDPKPLKIAPRTVKIYFHTTSPESSSMGVYEKAGEWDSFEVDNIEELQNDIENHYGSLRASSNKFHKSIYYTTVAPERDVKTGNETFYSIHLSEFPFEEQEEFYYLLFPKKISKSNPDLNPKTKSKNEPFTLMSAVDWRMKIDKLLVEREEERNPSRKKSSNEDGYNDYNIRFVQASNPSTWSIEEDKKAIEVLIKKIASIEKKFPKGCKGKAVAGELVEYNEMLIFFSCKLKKSGKKLKNPNPIEKQFRVEWFQGDESNDKSTCAVRYVNAKSKYEALQRVLSKEFEKFSAICFNNVRFVKPKKDVEDLVFDIANIMIEANDNLDSKNVYLSVVIDEKLQNQNPKKGK
jgi:hypothetical protein